MGAAARLVLVMMLATSCSDGPKTEAIIVVEAGAEIEASARVIRVEVRDADGMPVEFVDTSGMRSPRLERSLVDGEPDALSLPVRVRAVPRDGDATRGFEVVAEALDADGMVVGMAAQSGGYVEGEQTEVRVLLVPPTLCDDGTPPRCEGGELITCSGGIEVADRCVLGCSGSGTECRQLVPSNVGDLIPLDAGSGALEIVDETWIVDTDTGAIDAYLPMPGGPSGDPVRSVRDAVFGDDGSGVVFNHVDPGPAAPGQLAVLSVDTLTIRNGASLIGVGSLPLVIMAATDIDLAGRLTVAADELPDDPRPGAGGFLGALGGTELGDGPGGGQPGLVGDPSWHDSGGGGGSYATRGGTGGEAMAALGGEGGPTYGNEDIVPLQGGSGGGGGAPRYTELPGGNGGGAVQLVAAGAITIRSTGVIDASGAGGWSGSEVSGSGGGSGGAILVEAPRVVVEAGGGLGANGGAGAGGHNEIRGENGSAAGAPALGSGEGAAGRGGDGSDQDGVAGDGGDSQNAGGGGGGAGWIRINDATGTTELPGARILPRLGSCCAHQGAVGRTP
jgi:hypothetical protein